MKAVFVLRSVQSRWSPPFDKKIDEVDVEAELGKQFGELLPGTDGSPNIFTLVRLDDSKALVEFSSIVTLKGHEHPGNRRVWISKDEGTSFTYLWGDNGITKTLRFKGISPGGSFSEAPAAEQENEIVEDEAAQAQVSSVSSVGEDEETEITRPAPQSEPEISPDVAAEENVV